MPVLIFILLRLQTLQRQRLVRNVPVTAAEEDPPFPISDFRFRISDIRYPDILRNYFFPPGAGKLQSLFYGDPRPPRPRNLREESSGR